MNQIFTYSVEKVIEFITLINLLLFNSHRSITTTILVFSSSFILVFSTSIIIASLSFWYPTLDKYYENHEMEKVFQRNTLEFEFNSISDKHSNDRELAFILTKSHLSGSLKKRNPSTRFLPDEADIAVTEDLIQVVKVPTVLQSKTNHKESEHEAISAINKALQMKRSKKFDKALKLFRHALALQPLHPDVLNHYGEFVEEKERDLIKADEMFFKALIVSPKHSRALINRKRTLPVVMELDENELKRIEEKYVQLIQLNNNNPIFNQLKKKLYFQHIYHTVAIEGNTMTLDETRWVIESGIPVNGKSLTEQMEVIGVESALRYINKTLVTKDLITVYDILEIHKLVIGHVKPQIAGSFRKSQVFIADHTPPSASEVVFLMEEYVEWLSSEEFLQLHPVKQAALAHYKLVYIHPFIDGNGRTARLIMNLILMRHGYPPVIINNNMRNHYYDTLKLANEGDVRPFIRFIAHSTECTLNTYLHSTDYSKCLNHPEQIKLDNGNHIIAL